MIRLNLRLILKTAVAFIFCACGSNSNFTAEEDSILNKRLVAMDVSSDDEQVLGMGDDTVTDDDDSSETLPDDSEYNGDNGSDDNDNDDDSNGGQEDDDTSGQEPQNYICILDGPGKSVRLGLVDNKLGGQNAIPQVICMSERACLGEVSKAFEVKQAHRRGFCPNKNPHVKTLSDKEIKVLIDKVKSK